MAKANLIEKLLISLTVIFGLSTIGCSRLVNTVNGLTTYQSTISGSNYPFNVDSDTGALNTKYQQVDAKKIISKHESFEIALDSMFLRYLQASEPYVLIYSEAWMGSQVMPLDKTKLQRQIVLIKDGLSLNALVPITSVPLLGPVTMGDDALDVHLSIYVVVLSKADNKETIDYLNGAAAVASAASPQYAVLAGAAADIGKAIVAQNRDKIEFEHTFNFTPISTVSDIFKQNRDTGPNLEEGKIVVIKGENEYRLIPYQNWYYYLSPLNWLGHPPHSNSVRYEYDPDEARTKSIITLPFDYALGIIFPGPYGSFRQIFDSEEEFYPEHLHVCGNYLMTATSDPDDENQGIIDACSTRYFDFKIYHDKTYAILSIRRTGGSYGDFPSLYKAFQTAGYGSKIDELTTSYDEYLSKSTEALQKATESVQAAVKFERAKKQVYKLAGNVQTSNQTIDKIIKNSEIDNKEDQNKLEEIYWNELSIQSAKRIKTGVDAIIRIGESCDQLTTLIFYELNYWRIPSKTNNLNNTNDPYITTSRNISWNSILLSLQSYLNEQETTKTLKDCDVIKNSIKSESLNIVDD